jgi:GNAT superfamily N-acetyltransferase
MPPTVRQAVPGDAAAVAEYNRRLAWETEHKALDPAQLLAGVAAVLGDAARGIYFVAESEGEVVGQLAITYEWSDWRNGWFWWIQSVYVREDMRKAGVFRLLYDHVAALAKERGDVVGIRLYVETDNERARKTYDRLGLGATGYLVLERSPL